jgi:hypothetical protein
MSTKQHGDMDDHIHEHILASVHPDIERKHRHKSKALAIKLGMKPEVAEVLYGEPAKPQERSK